MVHKKNLGRNLLPGKRKQQQPKVDFLTTTSTLSISSVTFSRPGPGDLSTQLNSKAQTTTIPAMAHCTNPGTSSQEKKKQEAEVRASIS